MTINWYYGGNRGSVRQHTPRTANRKFYEKRESSVAEALSVPSCNQHQQGCVSPA